MDRNQTALVIGAQIDALRAARDATQDPAKKAAAKEAIEGLQAARDEIIVAAANEIGPLVDRAVAELQAVQNRSGTDAVTALGRTIENLRGLASEGGNG